MSFSLLLFPVCLKKKKKQTSVAHNPFRHCGRNTQALFISVRRLIQKTVGHLTKKLNLDCKAVRCYWQRLANRMKSKCTLVDQCVVWMTEKQKESKGRLIIVVTVFRSPILSSAAVFLVTLNWCFTQTKLPGSYFLFLILAKHAHQHSHLHLFLIMCYYCFEGSPRFYWSWGVEHDSVCSL